MELALFTIIVLGVCLVGGSTVHPTCPGDCYFGDFLHVKNRWDFYGSYLGSSPTCPLLNVTVGKYTSRELCFAKACELGGNVVQYGKIVTMQDDHYCAIYNCDSNENGTDWDYGWVDASVDRPVFARPHPFIPKCHSSYFVRRSLSNNWWRGDRPCLFITNHTDVDLRDCMSAACHDKANLFRFFPNESPQRCETMYCAYHSNEDDYQFNYKYSPDAVVYTLYHTAIDCNNQFKPEPMHIKLPACFERVSLCGQGNAEEAFCKTGANLIMYYHNSTTRSPTALRCKNNHERTGWDFNFVEDMCFGPEDHNEWLILPYPGTSFCNSFIFVIRRQRNECLMSSCDRSIIIDQAMDLRQCMLYACEYGANAINYYSGRDGLTSNWTSVKCDIRFCNIIENGKYDLKLENRSTLGYDIYSLVSYPDTSTTMTSHISTPTTPPVSSIEPTSESNATVKTVLNDTETSTFRTTTIIFGVILFLAICVIVTLSVMYKQQLELFQLTKENTLGHNPAKRNQIEPQNTNGLKNAA